MSRGTDTVSLLMALDGSFTPSDECKKTFLGRMRVLEAAFWLDRKTGKGSSRYVRNAHILMLSAGQELEQLAQSNTLTAASQRMTTNNRFWSAGV